MILIIIKFIGKLEIREEWCNSFSFLKNENKENKFASLTFFFFFLKTTKNIKKKKRKKRKEKITENTNMVFSKHDTIKGTTISNPMRNILNQITSSLLLKQKQKLRRTLR